MWLRPARRCRRPKLLRIFRRKRDAYRTTFKGPVAEIVLADLCRWCHFNKTTHVINDTHGSAQLEGRRQVILRIKRYVGLSDDEMEALIERSNAQEVSDA